MNILVYLVCMVLDCTIRGIHEDKEEEEEDEGANANVLVCLSL